MYLLILLLLLLSCNSPETKEIQQVKEERNITLSTPKDSTPEAEYTVSEMPIDDPEIIVKGTRTIKSVEDEIKRHLISVNYWYQRTPTLNQKRGVIIVGFSINELGVPSEIKLHKTSLKSDKFVKKVVSDIQRWRFAKMYDGAGITEVVYPIILEPSKPIQL